MTTSVTTQREIVSEKERGPQKGDSPAVSTRARARIPATDGDRNTKTPGVSREHRLRAWAAAWWVWTSKPPSLRQLWIMSRVDPRRVPGDIPLLRILWHLSNWTDRLLLFVLVLIAPTWLAGPVRWLAPRPFRRYGLYLCLLGLTLAHLIGRRSPP
jgi:hypothetical protein